MSIKTDAIVIRDETIAGANTATRVGTNLSDIADDLVAKQAAIDLNTAKVGITTQQAADIVTNNAKVGVTTEEANPDVVSQVEAEAGIATDERIWTAERVKQAIVALGGSGSVDDTAYGISWDGVTGIAPSKNVLYDFIENQVFKVDATSNIVPIFWGGTQAEYDIDFPAGHDPEYFIVITDGALTPTSASDIVNVPSGNLVATDVQGALDELQTELDANISFDSTSSTRLADTSGTNTGDQVIPVTGVDFDPVGTDNSTDVTLTTTGTSGAATLVGQVLNIPQYTGGTVTGSAVANKQITSKGVTIGDSTIADFAGNTGMATLIVDALDTARGDTVTEDANAGDTIAQQLTVWNADIEKANYDWIYVQVGHNDINDVSVPATVKAGYQALIDQINTDRKVGSVLIIGVLTPAYTRYETLYGIGAGADAAQANHDLFNTDIVNNEFGADYVINTYRYLMGDTDKDVLLAAYDSSDGIHPNNTGRQVNADEVRTLLNNLGFLATIDNNDWTKPTVREDSFLVSLLNADLNNIVQPIGNGTVGTPAYGIVIPNNTVLVDVEVGDKIEITPKFGTNHTIDATAITLLDPLSLALKISVGFRYILEYVDTDTWLLDGSADVSTLATKSGVIDFTGNKFPSASEYNNVFRFLGAAQQGFVVYDFATIGLPNGSWFDIIVDNATGTLTIEANGSTTFKLKSGISVTAMADGEYRKAIKIDTDTWYITD